MQIPTDFLHIEHFQFHARSHLKLEPVCPSPWQTPSPPVQSQDTAREDMQIQASESAPLELAHRSQSAKSDASHLDALASEFNEAGKAAAEEDHAGTPAAATLAPKGSICEVKEIFDTKTSSCACCTE